MGKLKQKTFEEIITEKEIEEKIKYLTKRNCNIKGYKMPEGYTIPLLRDVMLKYLVLEASDIFTKVLG